MKPRLACRWAMSASTYAELSLQLTTYQWSNRILAERMSLEPGMEIVDLGCGTGATSLAAFRQQPALRHAWAVDGVAEMLDKAREVLRGLPVTFVHESAETFSRSLPGRRISRILCNSAFFQFADPVSVLMEILQVLEPNGRFGLTVPGPAGDDQLEEIVTEVTVTSARWRECETFTTVPASDHPMPTRASKPTCDYRTIKGVLERGGFETLSSEFVSFEPTPEEIVRWLLLPVFRPPEWSSLTDEQATSALMTALARHPTMPRISWNLVVARPG